MQTVLPKHNHTRWYRFLRFMRDSFVVANCGPQMWLIRTRRVRSEYTIALMDLQLARLRNEDETKCLQDVANTRDDFEAFLDKIPFYITSERKPNLSRAGFLKALEVDEPFRKYESDVGVDPI